MRQISCLILFLFSACVSFPKADPNQVACQPRPGDVDPSRVVRGEPVVVKTVRFTDDGEFVSRCEATDLFNELKQDGPQIVVAYVHGWKHNGEPGDEDRQKFEEALTKVRAMEETGPAPRRVVGVFVAWNGKLTSAPVLKQLTFWSRKRAADRVSQSAAVTRLLGVIDSIRTKRAARSRDMAVNDLVVYAGHSLGARMLHNAVAQVLIHRTELAHPGEVDKPYESIHGTGDIVILLNPAFEASLFTTFNAVRRREYPFPDTQLPLLVSISSETDRATKIAFPLGQTLTGNHGPKRRLTVGNYEPFWTHRLTLATTPPTDAVPQPDICSTSTEVPEVCLFNIRPKDPMHVPFINATADKTVIDGHSDVWNPKLVAFLVRLIARSGAGDRIHRVAEAK